MTTPTTVVLSATAVVRLARAHVERAADEARWDLSMPHERWSDPEAQRAYVDLYDHVSVYATGPRTVVARVTGGNRRAKLIHGGRIAGAVLDIDTGSDAALITTEGHAATLTW